MCLRGSRSLKVSVDSTTPASLVIIIIIIIIYSSFTREFPTGVSAFLQGTLGIIWWMSEIQLVN